MNEDHLSMDERLDRARQLPPLISLDAAGRFLNSHSASSVSRPLQLSRTQPRTYLLAGGVMAVIVAIVFIVTSLFNQTPIADNGTKRQDAFTQKSTITPDDSVLKKAENTKPSHRPSVTNERFSTQATARTPADLEVQNRNIPAHFVSCAPEKIEEISTYDLSPAELRRLGVEVTSDGYIKEVWSPGAGGFRKWRLNSDGSTSHTFSGPMKNVIENDRGVHIYMKNGVRVIDTLKTPSAEFQSAVSNGDTADSQTDAARFGPYIWPVLISGRNGRRFQYNTAIASVVPPDMSKTRIDKTTLDQSLNLESGRKTLADLVAIRIMRPELPGDSTTRGDYFIYWYEPTPEFVSALPEKVRRAVSEDAERRARKIEKIQNGKDAKGPRILEAAIFPNPVTQDLATVQYTMPEPGRVAVSLYDIQGKRLKELSSCEDRAEGTWENRISVADIPPGMYLLAVTTESGQQAVQKIVVQR